MSEFGEAVGKFIEEHQGSFLRRDTSTCELMEPNVRNVLNELPQYPNRGRFYQADLQWWPEVEHIEDIVTSAKSISLNNCIVFAKNPPTGDLKKTSALRILIGEQNLTALFQDADGKEYLFAANSWGRVIRPLMDQDLLPIFKDALAQAQLQNNGVLPQWPYRWSQ